MSRRHVWRRVGRGVARGLGLLCGLGLAALARAEVPDRLGLSAEERAAIVSLGPWPPAAPATDPGNAAAGRPAAIALGRRLFFERRLSAEGDRSCAFCHRPELAWTDGLARPPGRDGTPLPRHTPTVLDAGRSRWLGWDGAADSLWSQALRPLLDVRELGSSAARVSAVIAADATLACLYRRAWGEAPDPQAAEATLVRAAKAIGAWTATLHSGRTPFDTFRDALARGDLAAAAAYPPEARRGLQRFVGEGRCIACHGGPGFTNGEFADIGRPYFSAPGVVDAGRAAGLAARHASAYRLDGPWSDEPAGAAATQAARAQPMPRQFGEFKVPGLRGVARSAPHGHDGSLPDLAAVLRHYSELDLERLHADGEQILRPTGWGPTERAEVIAFLRTLDDPQALARAEAERQMAKRPEPDCPAGPR